MKKLEIYNVWSNGPYTVDIEIQDEEIIIDIPYFDREGDEITYDEAVGIYGTDGLDDVFDDEKYLSHIQKWIEENE